MSAPGPSLRFFASTHDSSAETLAPSTSVSDQLMGGMPAGYEGKSCNSAKTLCCSQESVAWQTTGLRGSD